MDGLGALREGIFAEEAQEFQELVPQVVPKGEDLRKGKLEE